MKYFIMAALSLLFSIAAVAEEIPDYMKDGQIVVTLKDGKQYTFSTNEYKVVKRGTSASPVVAIVKSASENNDAEVKELREQVAELSKHQQKKNRVKVLGGVGNTGFNTEVTATRATVETKRGAVGGVGYDRMLNDKFSVGSQIQTNDTLLLNFGLDF